MSPTASVFKCGVCKETIRKTQPSIQCKICTLWIHVPCAGITDSALTALKANKSLSFSCSACDSNPRAGLESVLQKEIGDLNSKIDAFINKVDGEQTSIRQALADTVRVLNWRWLPV
ncbi:hypothetical protein CVS40_5781 [Lucilia cuprina]|nr:hypothetical protein CVS40_5781 [Lucilia cuprina]